MTFVFESGGLISDDDSFVLLGVHKRAFVEGRRRAKKMSFLAPQLVSKFGNCAFWE